MLHIRYNNPTSGMGAAATWPDIFQTVQETPGAQMAGLCATQCFPLASVNTMPRHHMLLRLQAF